MRLRLGAIIPVALLAALARCSEFATANDGPAPDAGDEAEAGDEAGGDAGSCVRTPYVLGQTIERGSVCGVGACRVVLTGDCPKASLGEEPPSVCTAAFPPESCATPTDENCDGVLDEGCPIGISPEAGTSCVGCAKGRRVKRGADGTISGVVGNHEDFFTTTDCINSAHCAFGEARWVHNMAGRGTNCATFCASIKGTCVEECTTSQGSCAPEAASVNQNNRRFGTFAEDYACMELDDAGRRTGVPNTGDCKFVPRDFGFGPVADNRFNVRCCCKL